MQSKSFSICEVLLSMILDYGVTLKCQCQSQQIKEPNGAQVIQCKGQHESGHNMNEREEKKSES